MAKGPRYRVPFRRRRENKTNYPKRLKLLSSKRPRIVVRKTNKNMIIQLVGLGNKGDVTSISVITGELAKYGYELPTGNIPAAYLTGLLFGLKVKARLEGSQKSKISVPQKSKIFAEMDGAILDTGLNTSVKGSRIYASLKGMLDVGMSIPHDPKILPDKRMVEGERMGKNVQEKIEKVKETVISSFGEYQ
jgi:Ribosomal protein L18